MQGLGYGMPGLGYGMQGLGYGMQGLVFGMQMHHEEGGLAMTMFPDCGTCERTSELTKLAFEHMSGTRAEGSFH